MGNSLIRTKSCKIFVLFILGILATIQAQNVYEIGTFVSYPAGKHINHSYFSTWDVFFASEDGVLVYNHQEGKWKNPLTASDGLSQYPALLVWHDQAARNVWIITPDFVFIYDELSAWMSRQSLPEYTEFNGKYRLGLLDDKVIIRSQNETADNNTSAIFFKGTGAFDQWGLDSMLNINWDQVRWVNPGVNASKQLLPAQAIDGGQLDISGRIQLDGYPAQAACEVSTLVQDDVGNEAFLGTYGMGIFHRKIRGGTFKPLPFGLLTPDVMSLYQWGDSLIVGGRAGVTVLHDYHPHYYEALRDPVYDYSFVSSIAEYESDVFIAGRQGVFQKAQGTTQWTRLLKMDDLVSKRIYSIAAGNDGLVMIGTERNAYLYHESGSLIHTLFSSGLDWPVFDVKYSHGVFYLSTLYGLYVFDSDIMKFTDRITSHGQVESPHTDASIDPMYEAVIDSAQLWASSHRGLLHLNLTTMDAGSVLAPSTPFKPRGIAFVGGRVWIGTEVGLQSYAYKTSSWRHYTHNDGLISDFITDLVANEEYIWLGTNLGLTRIKWKNLY
ncbi:MAG: hypothetical protein K9N38_04845 [Candidatus Marinimicrobia bacterium]|nr:hypothetical protein [Candidatus Neomarinimicrobiota bacterium]